MAMATGLILHGRADMATMATLPFPHFPRGRTMDSLHTVQTLIEQHRHQPGALLPLLHAIQDRLGHVPDSAVEPIARALNRSRAEVHGVLTYYHHFRRTPPGRHVVQVCRAEACQACGSEGLLARAAEILGCAPHETRADGAVTLEPVYCLGLCAQSPAIAIDGQPRARMTPERLQALATRLEIAR
jgi:formate dehydrogenase subunit gamma